MNICLPYGTSGLEIPVPDSADIIEPVDVPALPDEERAARESFREPEGSLPPGELVGRDHSVAIVINDITRPTPSDRILPWILKELPHVPLGNIVIIIGNGTHRPCSPGEIRRLTGEGIYSRIEIVNHDSFDASSNTHCGTLTDGTPVYLNSRYAGADRRIGIGFIEPHFFAGFSGGPKVIMPGIAGIETIMRFHRPEMILDPGSTWGILDGNPVQEMSRAAAGMCPPDFSVNVSLNRAGGITGFFSGSMGDAHRTGARRVGDHAMKKCTGRYDIVVTSNCGYPLDQNLYQAVKGICAAHAILKPGGTILCVAECRDGVPDHGNFRKLMALECPQAALADRLLGPESAVLDGWQALKLALVLKNACVHLHSSLPDEVVRASHLTPCPDPGRLLAELAAGIGPNARIAVLPQGPMVIPYCT